MAVAVAKATQSPTRFLFMRGPHIRPKKKREERRVFLEPSQWADLTDAADVHTEAFRAMGVEETVSRNDLLEGFLTWAADVFWAEHGGRPSTKAERERVVASLVSKLKAESKTER